LKVYIKLIPELVYLFWAY